MRYRLTLALALFFTILSGPVVLACDGDKLKLAFIDAEVTSVPGTLELNPVHVAIVDRAGKIVTRSDCASALIQIDLIDVSGKADLLGTRAVAAVSGIATFTNLKISTSGFNYLLHATSENLKMGLSDPFDL